MNALGDIAQKREMLFTIRTLFSPQTQPIKETAIDKILEQNLFLTDQTTGVTFQQIQELETFRFRNGHHVISSKDIKDSISRLLSKNRVNISREDGNIEVYKLSEGALSELEWLMHETKVNFEYVVKNLFKNTSTPLSYSAPFLRCLSIVFSKLGERQVQIITGDIKGDELLSSPLIISAIDQIKKEFSSIDATLFKHSIFIFFQESNPRYDNLKWNMAQNYYICKVIGLDPSSHLLSKELFGGASLYLDTNVMVAALEEEHEHHKSFRELGNACKNLNIKLRACQVSIDELRGFIANQQELFKKVVDQIPEETIKKVGGVFLKMYHKQLKSKGEVDFNELFNSFNSPTEDLKKTFGVELEDDRWFDEAQNEGVTKDLAKELSRRYLELRGRFKHERSAIVDATLIRWLQKNKKPDNKLGLLTLDTSLPGSLKSGRDQPFIITLDALLQWISPIAIQFKDGKDFASVFSETVKYQLLPKDTFFELKDFLIFSDMHMSCKELPAEDVEECIRYIKFNAPTLDPSKPTDREKLSYEITKFFADPGRKFKQEIERLESEQKTIKETYEKTLGEAISRIKNLEEQNRKIKEDDQERIANLERKFSEQEARNKNESLRKSGQMRLSLVGVILIVYEVIIFNFAKASSEGSNLFQKLINAWPLISIGPVLSLIISWFYLGKERIRTLRWPFTKFL